MDIPVLDANVEDVEGFVYWPDDWHNNPAITRADLLKDWLSELSHEYEVAVAELSKPSLLQS